MSLNKKLILKIKKKEKEDLKRIQMIGVIFAVVEKGIFHMQLYIPMLRLNIKVYFQKEPKILKKKENKVRVQIAGK